MTARSRRGDDEGAEARTVRLATATRLPPVRVRTCRLRVVAGPDQGRVFTSSAALIGIGKGSASDLVLADGAVSRLHAQIEEHEHGFLLRDMDSTNGTFVKGNRIREIFLSGPTEIVLGGTRLVFDELVECHPVLVPDDPRCASLIGQSAAMRTLYGYLARVAPTELSVLLSGETGTGKEVVARAVHQLSARRAAPFVVLDCAGVEPGLIGAAMFGHRAGAFTGATGARKGAFLAAHGGTLFLDEVGELPLDLQPKLLRALERREVQPLGADAPVCVDVRIVSATHRSLPRMVADGLYRQDLFYRLSGLVLELPPLRARAGDVAVLAAHFVEGSGKSLAPAAIRRLEAHAWPGNVRELRNVIDRAIAFARGPRILDEDVVMESVAPAPPESQPGADEPPSLEAAEKRVIVAALQRCGWNRSQAARDLGITRQTLKNRMARLGVRSPDGA